MCFKGITKLKKQWHREKQEETYKNLVVQIFDELMEEYEPGDPALPFAAMNHVGVLHFMQGQYDEAIPLLRSAHEGIEALGGPYTEQLHNAKCDLANVLMAQGDVESARDILAEARDRARSTFGDEDPTSLRRSTRNSDV